MCSLDIYDNFERFDSLDYYNLAFTFCLTLSFISEHFDILDTLDSSHSEFNYFELLTLLTIELYCFYKFDFLTRLLLFIPK